MIPQNSVIRVLKGYGRTNRRSFAALALLIIAAGCGGGGGGTGSGAGSGSDGSAEGKGSPGPPDTTAPTITGMTPGQDSAGTGTNSKITATFSEPMVQATIDSANFRLTDGISAIAGIVSYDTTNNIAVFAPAGSLAPNTRYTATVVTGIKDLANTPLTTDFAWDFVTGGTVDVAAPDLISTIPVNAATDIAINRRISATFSKDMDSSTLTSVNFTVTGPDGIPVSGTVEYIGRTAIFSPAHDFLSNAAYSATITTGVMDLAGNALQEDVIWNFTTSGNADIAAPVVISTSPANAESGVAISSTINAIFNESMDAITITTANFTVTGPGVTPVIGTVAFDATSNTAIFTRINHLTTPVSIRTTPVSNLEPNTTYTATLITGAKDMAGNALANNVIWSFTTAP